MYQVNIRNMRTDKFNNGVGMYTIIYFCKFALCRPFQSLLFLRLQTLEFGYQIQFEFRTQPTGKLKCNISVCKRTAVIARFRNNTDCIRCLNPFLRREIKAVLACRTLKGLEFVSFEIRIVQFFPQAEIGYYVLITHPRCYRDFRFGRICIPRQVCKRYVIFLVYLFIMNANAVYIYFLVSHNNTPACFYIIISYFVDKSNEAGKQSNPT